MPENQSLKAARKWRRWTQTQAAEKCGVDLQTYYRWENRIQEPHGYNMEQLCLVFKASMEQLGYAHLIEVKEEGETAAAPEDQTGSLIRLTPQQIAALIPLVGDSTVDQKRRNTLQAILTAAGVAVTAPLTLVESEPWKRLITEKPSNMNAASIAHFRDLIETCWKLSNTDELDVAEGILPQFLPRLEVLAARQSEVADLAAQALQLKSVLVAHRLKLAEKVTLCQQSVAYARLSNNKNTLVAALAQLAVAYQYANRPEDVLSTYQEALSHQASPLLQARVYAESAAILATYGRKKEARFYMDLADETFPDHPENDPSYLFADCPKVVISLYRGMAFLDMEQPADAWNSFEQSQKKASGEVTPARIGLEVINHQGRAALALGDLDKYVWCIESGLAGAVTLGSQKRYNEAITTFRQDMPAAWYKELQIKRVIEQYALI